MTREERHIAVLNRMLENMDVYDSIQPTTERKKAIKSAIQALSQEPKTGHCKECKYFEYDSVAKVDGIPLIVAHEICNKWGNGCKTSEDGYCYLFEPPESEEISERNMKMWEELFKAKSEDKE